MSDEQQRIDRLTGLPAVDVSVNPLAIERKAKEGEKRAAEIAEANAPWSRERLERLKAKLRAGAEGQETVETSGGEVLGPSLNLHGAALVGLDLSGMDFSFSNLHGADLSRTILTGANFHRANVCQANFRDAKLEGCDFSAANVSEACLCGADCSNASFKGANLSDSCYERSVGFDVVEKALTAAERDAAKHARVDGSRVVIREDLGVSLHFGPTLAGANVTGLRNTHAE
jgi:uncharacterized protein YjbI with pentapeptide repeats